MYIHYAVVYWSAQIDSKSLFNIYVMLQLLMYGQPYIVKLQLEMPESSVNQRLGNVIIVVLLF